MVVVEVTVVVDVVEVRLVVGSGVVVDGGTVDVVMPMQNPFWHVSFTVEPEPSTQGVPLATGSPM